MAITVEIYEEIRQCREKYGYGQRQTARLLKVSRNTVKKYWEGKLLQTFCSLLMASITVYAGGWYALAGMGVLVILILAMQKRLAISKKMVYNANSISWRKSPCYFAKKSSAPAAIVPMEPSWRKD